MVVSFSFSHEVDPHLNVVLRARGLGFRFIGSVARSCYWLRSVPGRFARRIGFFGRFLL